MLLVGHGSKLPYNKELILETGRMIQERSDAFTVRCGFMSMNEPSVTDQLEAFRHEPIEALVVVPLFLARGVHIEKDIPALLGLAEGQKTGTFGANGSTIPRSTSPHWQPLISRGSGTSNSKRWVASKAAKADRTPSPVPGMTPIPRQSASMGSKTCSTNARACSFP